MQKRNGEGETDACVAIIQVSDEVASGCNHGGGKKLINFVDI